MSKNPIIYLSPAVHARDRACACGNCTENTHTAQYADLLEKHLAAAGFSVRCNRVCGAEGVRRAVQESNDCGAALHYVIHTSESGRSGSTVVAAPGDAAYAEAIAKERRTVYPGAVQTVSAADLYEVVFTAAPSVYDYILSHKNAADAAWFHAHMDELARAAARAICRLFGRQAKGI